MFIFQKKNVFLVSLDGAEVVYDSNIKQINRLSLQILDPAVLVSEVKSHSTWRCRFAIKK